MIMNRNNMLSLAISLLLVIFSSESAYSDLLQSFVNSIDDNRINNVFFWETGGDRLCCICKTSDGSLRFSLVIYRFSDSNKKVIGSFPIGVLPLSLSEFGGKLVCVSETGTAFLINVFDYKNGKVRRIISDGSNLPPEFFYIGSSNEPSISVPKLEWVNGEKIPASADIYIIGEGVREFKKIPWEKRFSVLSNTTQSGVIPK